MVQFQGAMTKFPARAAAVWYVVLILIGTLLLCHPNSSARPAEDPVTWQEAFFTATSAACVTGLAVRSTGNDFSLFGQIIILLLIQLGGMGIMTVTTLIMLRFGSEETLRVRAVAAETLGGTMDQSVQPLLLRVIGSVVVFEVLGFLLLFPGLLWLEGQTLSQAAWGALFHSISAFCNAGFSLHDDSLVRYQGNYWINSVICFLIISGGIGFPVIRDLTNLRIPRRRRWEKSTLHTKIMLIGSAVLIVAGAVAFGLFEWNNALADHPIGEKLLISVFQSVTARTAGFNTVDLSLCSSGTLFVLMLLMVVGGGPCSTAGGFKVSTLAVIALQAWTLWRGRVRITLFRRTIPRGTIERASLAIGVFAVIGAVGLTLLLASQHSGVAYTQTANRFMDASFETASALGTVGLSTGFTTLVNEQARGVWYLDLGRGTLILLMFLGRLGPIAIFVAFAQGEREKHIEYASEEPLVG